MMAFEITLVALLFGQKPSSSDWLTPPELVSYVPPSAGPLPPCPSRSLATMRQVGGMPP